MNKILEDSSKQIHAKSAIPFVNNHVDQHQHGIIRDYESLLELIMPRRRTSATGESNPLNLSPVDLYEMRLMMIGLFVFQFTCCVLLMLLNNWHTIVDLWARRPIRRTLSVLEFERKVNAERTRLKQLYSERQAKKREKMAVEQQQHQQQQETCNDDDNGLEIFKIRREHSV